MDASMCHSNDHPHPQKCSATSGKKAIKLSLEQALELHAKAEANYKYICSKVRKDMPALKDVYQNKLKVDFAPPDLNLETLFNYWNDIAKAHFVAQPSLHIHVNRIIFHYAMDKGHSFTVRLDQSRINVVLAIFTWAAEMVENQGKEYNDYDYLWPHYINAWIESIIPGASFFNCDIFVETWAASSQEMAWFPARSKDQMLEALVNLSAGVPPLKCDPVEFLQMCKDGRISKQVFHRIGPKMAMHYVLAQERSLAKKKALPQWEKKADEMVWTEPMVEQRGQPLVQQTALDDDDDDDDVDSDDNDYWEAESKLWAVDEEGQDGVEDKEQEEEDKMDMNEDPSRFYEGINLTTLPWDGPCLKALTSIDRTIPFKLGYRPKSTRSEWIDAKHALKTFFTLDALAGAMKMLSVKEPEEGVEGYVGDDEQT